MNKKKQKFLEEYSENFADLFVETFSVRYGLINDYDVFIEDFKECVALTKEKMKKKIAAKIANKVTNGDK